MMTRQLFCRCVLPHLAVGPLVLLARLAPDWDLPGPLRWVPGLLVVAALAAAAGAWGISAAATATNLLGLGPLAAAGRGLAAVDRFLESLGRDCQDEFQDLAELILYLGTLVALFAAAVAALALSLFVWDSPVLFALVCQLADLALLAGALWRSGAWRTVRALEEAAGVDRDRRAAQEAVRAYYAENEDLVADVFPRVLFDADLRLRFPDSASPEEAWTAARELLATLRDTAREGRRARDRELAAALPADPIADRSLDVRGLVRALEVQIGQVDEEVRRQREAGLNTAVLERQLADLRRRKRDAEDELRRLVEPPPRAPASEGPPCP